MLLLAGQLITIILVLAIPSSHAFTPLTNNYNFRPTNSVTLKDMAMASTGQNKPVHEIENVLFIECGTSNRVFIHQSSAYVAYRICAAHLCRIHIQHSIINRIWK
jgi:hypothetical protein